MSQFQFIEIEPLFEITPAGKAYLADDFHAANAAEDTVSDRWRAGFAAHGRGEIPPADPEAAEGWYCAENTAARWAGKWSERV